MTNPITVYVAEIHWLDDTPGYYRFAAVALSLSAIVAGLEEQQNIRIFKALLEPGIYHGPGCMVRIRAMKLVQEAT